MVLFSICSLCQEMDFPCTLQARAYQVHQQLTLSFQLLEEMVQLRILTCVAEFWQDFWEQNFLVC